MGYLTHFPGGIDLPCSFRAVSADLMGTRGDARPPGCVPPIAGGFWPTMLFPRRCQWKGLTPREAGEASQWLRRLPPRGVRARVLSPEKRIFRFGESDRPGRAIRRPAEWSGDGSGGLTLSKAYRIQPAQRPRQQITPLEGTLWDRGQQPDGILLQHPTIFLRGARGMTLLLRRAGCIRCWILPVHSCLAAAVPA